MSVKVTMYDEELTTENIEHHLFQRERALDNIHQELLVLAASTPRDRVDSAGHTMSWEEFVLFKVADLCDDYFNAAIDLRVAEVLQSAIKCEHDDYEEYDKL